MECERERCDRLGERDLFEDLDEDLDETDLWLLTETGEREGVLDNDMECCLCRLIDLEKDLAEYLESELFDRERDP